jgi:two-component sensor histidine kinase
MSLIHEQLYQAGNLAQIDFGDYLGHLVSNLSQTYEKGVKIAVDADPVLLEIDSAVPSGLILNELVTNAFKHAFPTDWISATGSPEPSIRVSLSTAQDQRVSLEISDNGVGMPPGLDWLTTDSLGMMLIHSLVDQLDGEIKLGADNGVGTKFTVTFLPLKTGLPK